MWGSRACGRHVPKKKHPSWETCRTAPKNITKHFRFLQGLIFFFFFIFDIFTAIGAVTCDPLICITMWVSGNSVKA